MKKRKADIHQIPILVYHKIEYRKELGVNAVHPDRFRSQIKFLKESGYQAITCKDVLQRSKLPDRPIIITFDDGYECIYKYAMPILEEVSFPAVVFIITGFIGKPNVWDVNLGGVKFSHLTHEQIRDLHRKGWEIGSHGVTHRALPYLNTQQMAQEIYLSKKLLEDLLDEAIFSLAFPFGFYNYRVLEAVERAGYRFVLTNGHLPQSYCKRNSCLALKRIPVYQTDTSSKLKKRLNPVNQSKSDNFKIFLFSFPRRFTPIYQLLFKRELTLENYK